MAIVRPMITIRKHVVNKQRYRRNQKAKAIVRSQAIVSRVLKPVSVASPKVNIWGIEGLMGEVHVFSFKKFFVSICFPPSLISTYSLVSHTHPCHSCNSRHIFLLRYTHNSSKGVPQVSTQKNCANNFCLSTQLPIFLIGIEVFVVMQRGIGSCVYA